MGGMLSSVHFPFEHMSMRTCEPPLQVLPSWLHGFPFEPERSFGQPSAGTSAAGLFEQPSAATTTRTSERPETRTTAIVPLLAHGVGREARAFFLFSSLPAKAAEGRGTSDRFALAFAKP